MSLRCLKLCIGYFRPYNGVKTPVILQQTSTECGLAALTIIFNYYKCYISIEELRNQYGLSRDGTKIIDLIHIAEYYRFHVQAYTIDMEAIDYITEPVIAFWNFNHFVVINGAGYQKIFINDPGKGVYAVSLKTFNKSFTGIVLHFTPPITGLPVKKRPKYIKTLVQQVTNSFRKEIIFIALINVFINCHPIISSGLMKVFIDYCVLGENSAWFLTLIGLLIASNFIPLLTTLPLKWIEYKLCLSASLKHAKKIIQHLLYLPLIYFAVRQKSEMIVLLTQMNVCVERIYKTFLTIFSRIIILVVLLLSMALINLQWTLIVGLMVLINVIIIGLSTKIKLNNELTNQHLICKHHARTTAWIKNLATIKSCALENNIFELWYGNLISKLQQHEKIYHIDALFTVIQQLFTQCIYLAIIFIGGIAIAFNTATMGQLIFFLSLTSLSTTALNALLQAVIENQQSLTTYGRINEITRNKIDPQFLPPASYSANSKQRNVSSQRAVNIENTRQRNTIIRCNEVSFSYNKRLAPIINNLTLGIVSGDHVGIVGRTGSGKSTLAKLLCGLYHAEQGHIYINRVDMDTITSEMRARMFAYVSQDTMLLRGSLFDNLTLGNPDPNNHIMEQGIYIACLEEVIHEKGLYSEVEENAINFSGGEKQRINIARAIIQDTPVLILDEATASLDETMEAQLIHRLRQTPKTIIFVAHRLASVKHCDRIIVIDQGTIVESGTHKALLQQNGFYAQLTVAKSSS